MKVKYNKETIDNIIKLLNSLEVKGIDNNIIISNIYNSLTRNCEIEENTNQEEEEVKQEEE